jgi:hypothetical protein
MGVLWVPVPEGTLLGLEPENPEPFPALPLAVEDPEKPDPLPEDLEPLEKLEEDLAPLEMPPEKPPPLPPPRSTMAMGAAMAQPEDPHATKTTDEITTAKMPRKRKNFTA